MMKKLLTCAAMTACLAFAQQARAESGGVKIGALSCHVSSGWGWVVGSSRNLDCTFSGNQAHIERYRGNISKFGADIGYQHAGAIVWAVFAPTSDLGPGALAGHYGGATAGVTVGVGLGAHVLIGGFNNSIALQPLSVEGMTGVNVAAGIGAMTLEAVAS